jgi:hypothetical protein
MKNNKVIIVGFECLVMNGRYIYPRSKIDTKYHRSIKLFKYNNRYYCDINDLFKNIYEREYNHRRKNNDKVKKYVSDFIEKYSINHVDETLKKEKTKICSELKLYYDNYKFIKNNDWTKLDDSGYFCKNIDIVKVSDNIYRTEHYKYNKIEN